MKAFFRKMSFGVVGAVWSIALWSGPGWAQSNPPALPDRPLTLKDCVRLALKQNPLQRAALMGLAAATEAVGEARAPYYPELGFQAGYRRWQTHAFLPEAVPLPPGASTVLGPTNDWLAGLRARYTLYDFGERQSQLRIAQARQGLAEEEGFRIRQDIIFGVYQSFYGLTSAQEIKAVAEQNLERTRDHLRLTLLRKEAGAAPKADILRAQVEVSNAELSLVRTGNLIRIARGNLNTVMGLPVDLGLEVVAGPAKITAPEQNALTPALDQAVLIRPEINAARKRIEASLQAVEAAKSAFGPRLKAEGMYGWRDKDFLPQDEDWLIGVSIDWPLFVGFARKHRLARAKADLSKEEAEAERVELIVRQEVWNAFSKVQEAYQAVETGRVLVQHAEESLRMSKERYEVGAGTITDLLDAQTALARAQASRVEAEWDYFIAQAQFQRAAGRLGLE